MANIYRLSGWRRLVNWLVTGLLRVGLVPRTTYLLTARGRKTGELHSTPVTLVERDGQRWLVAPYGEVSWVRNARAAGQVMFSKGGRSETVRIAEVAPEEAASVLKEYLTRVPVVGPFFDVTPQSPLDAFAAEAPRHPVFRVVGGTTDSTGAGRS